MSSVWKRVVVVSTVSAVMAAGLTISSPPTVAHAQDQDVTDILAGFDQWVTLSKDLGNVGALGQQIPLVPLVPSGANALDFGTLFQKALHDPLSSGKNSLGDLDGTYPLSFGDSRTGSLVVHTSGGTTETVTTDFTVNRTVSSSLHASTTSAPKIALDVPASVSLALTSHLAWTYNTSTHVFALVHDSTSPKLHVGVHASLTTSGDAAIGIMGVTVDGSSTFSLDAGLSITADDPNNDGHLAFAEAGGTPGELAASGAAAGLFHASLDAGGSATGDISFTTKALTGFPGGPLSASVTVDWPDVTTGAPTLTPHADLSPLAKFETLSAKDLSDGIKHLADTVTALQRAKFTSASNAVGDINLPFMKGSVADAVTAAETLAAFVSQNTQPATAGSAVAGQPTFASLQEFLTRLDGTNGPGGSVMHVSGTAWDDATSKLSFTLDLSRSAASTALNAPVVLAANSGAGVTYGANTLTDTHQAFAANQLQGRQVVAGASTGTVASNTATTITLTANWSSGTPGAGTAYKVQSADAKTGEVQLGDLLKNAGIKQANSVNATATVRATYDAHVTVVLDLEAAKTGSDCDPAADPLRDPSDSATACPYKRKNLDGSQTVIDEQPPNVDRIMLRTGAPLLSAGMRIDSAVDVDASVGYLGVHLGGTLAVCSRSNDAQCSDTSSDPQDMVTLSLKDVGDLSLDRVFSMLATDPTSLLTGDLSVRAYASLSASVPDVGGGSFPAMSASLTMDDIRHPTAVTPTLSGFDPVKAFNFNPDNPTQLFAQILKALRLVNDQLGVLKPSDTDSSSFLGTKIPVLGKSIGELISAPTTSDGAGVTYATSSPTSSLTDPNATFDSSFVGRSVVIGTYVGVVGAASGHVLTFAPAFSSQPPDGTPYSMRTELDDALDKLAANPPDNLQKMIQALQDALGDSSPVKVGFEPTPTPHIVFDVDWNRQAHTAAAVSFDLSQLGINNDVVGAQADGTVGLTLKGEAKLRLLMPLSTGDGPATPTDLQVDQDPSHTGLSLDVQGDADNFHVGANIGPLALSLGDPNGGDPAQAHAHYGVSLASSGTGTTDLGTFLSNLKVSLSSATDQVKCGTGVDQDGMALCAHLPLYVNSGGGWQKIDPTDYSINVRLPRTSDLNDAFDVTGAQIDSQDRLQIPADLGTKIANAVLNFGALNDGIDRYLAMLEAGLRLASANGKLPLVGDDVQKGADFIGDVRTKFQNALGSASGIHDFDSLSTWGSTTLSNALGFPVTVAASCKYTLEKATNVKVTNDGSGAAGDKETYAVIAQQNGADTAKSDDVTVDNSLLPPTAAHPNTVTWDSVVGADKYVIVRKNGSNYDKIGTVDAGGTLSFDDTGQAANPASYPVKTTTIEVTKCASGVGADKLTGVDFTVDIKSDPAVTFASTGGCGTNCTTAASVPLDIGIPGLSLSADGPSDHDIKVEYGYSIHLKFGLNKDKGFVVYTKDAAQPIPEVQLGLSLSLPSQITARVAFLKANLKNHDSGAGTLFGGTFGIDLKQTGATTCWAYDVSKPECATAGDGAPITLAELADITDHVDASLHGGVNIDWDFDAGIDPALPGLAGEFKLSWTFALGTDETKVGDLDISFPHVYLDVGTFLEKLLGPVFDEIKSITGPLQPIIDTLYAPIPVLSDLSHLVGGPDVTLISIAKAFSTLAGGPDLTFVDRVLAAVQLANQVLGGGGRIDLGSFDVTGSSALDTQNTPASAGGLITGASAINDAPAQVDANSNGGSKGIVTGSGSKGEKAGFKFPLLEDPTKAFGLLMGQDVDLVTFDSGNLSLGFSYSQAFGPVYAPPPVLITISGSASVTAHIKAGFDTYGIRKAVEAKKVDIGILDSLYLGTRNDDGTTLQVLQFQGSIGAGAQVSVLILTVGVEGGITLTVGFSWNDPTPEDGKFRFGEFAATALNNPICLFNVSGKLSLYLKVYITVGISPFSVSFDINLANITLLDFSVSPDCTPPPPVLAEGQGGVLIVHAGRLASDTGGGKNLRGDHAYDPIQDVSKAGEAVDKVTVTELHDWTQSGHPFIGFAVSAIGERQVYTGVTRVLVDGHGFPGALDLTFQGDGDTTNTDGSDKSNVASSPFDKDVIVFGGDGPDIIRTGVGRSYVDGGPGDDQITTTDFRPTGMAAGDAPPSAVVAGGPGKDQITVGGGDDWVAGDASLTWVGKAIGGTTVFDWTTDFATGPAKGSTADHPAAPADGADTIAVGLGKNQVFGGAGADIIGVAADNPLNKSTPDEAYHSRGDTIVAGGDGDHVSAGSGDDTIFTGNQVATAEDGPGDGDVATDVNTVDTGTGNDTVYGGTGQDQVAGHSLQNQVDKIYGGAGKDTLAGGFGQDQVFGGPDEDLVLAEPSQITGGTPTLLPLPQGVTPQHKLLVGGDQNDVIYGGNGGADIFGDRHESACTTPGSDPQSDPPSETSTGSPGADTIYGGNGVDVVAAGAQDDTVFAYGGDDLVCGQAGNDSLSLGSGQDTGYGGTGDDTMLGDEGNDHVYGNDGKDTLYGGDGTDVLEGNAGSDTESGGTGNDLVVGGTRFAGRPDVGDTLYGDDGTDTLIGDNGDGTGDAAHAYDLDTAPAADGGADTIYGGAADDRALGGLAGDTMYAGTGDDWFEGNNASDTIYGEDGEDRLVGGSTQAASGGGGEPDTGDVIRGGDGPDLITGDNAVLTRHAGGSGTPVTLGRGFSYGYDVSLFDLGSVSGSTSGPDDLGGDGGQDVIYGQGDSDYVHGDAGDDAVEGDQGVDWVEGNAGDDDLVGGSTTPSGGSGDTTTGQLDSADAVYGGAGDDVVLGDNGVALRIGTPSRVTARTGSAGTAYTPRAIQLFDLRNGGSLLTAPPAGRAGQDRLSGGDGNDLLFGQDEADYISGGGGADYLEGDGGADQLRGDALLAAASTETVSLPIGGSFPGTQTAAPDLEGTAPAGQDDIVGGSTIAGFRDTGDTVEGDGGDDVVLGDNGRLVRTTTTIAGVLRDQPYVDRYPPNALPVDATTVRTSGDAGVPTRYCTADQPTCDVSGAFGNDTIYGDDGNDGLWGQDGNDLIRGGNGADDIFGELGDDTLFGDAGQDAILGDRGGVVDTYIDPTRNATLGFTDTTSGTPKETYVGFKIGSYDRRVDLRHDTDGAAWIGSSTSAAMPHNGTDEGGNDQIRGGLDADNIHAGFGDDLANGDSGGDVVFGDDGADVLWGGKGCDPVVDAATPDCQGASGFDPTARGNGDRFVDHVFGGAGGTSASSLTNVLGSDLLDFNPRGSYAPGIGCTTGQWPQTLTANKKTPVTIDPCTWFVMTNKDDDTASPATLVNNQHHQGTDWLYGGWDRDVLQGDVAQNGPNPGDRLLDWNGSYNLYTHCNSAYGGYNDVRLHSPDMQQFLQQVSYGDSLGRSLSDVTTAGTSAFDELALAYPGTDNAHSAGGAYPTTPGHFDDPVSCTD